MVYLENTTIGNDGENLQGDIIFSFVDVFVNGQARLEYEIDDGKHFILLEKDGETYKTPIKSVLTKTGSINMQLVVTEGIDENDKLVRHFVPCYRNSDDEIGLYDLVNSVFYTNEGTVTFKKGNNI